MVSLLVYTSSFQVEVPFLGQKVSFRVERVEFFCLQFSITNFIDYTITSKITRTLSLWLITQSLVTLFKQQFFLLFQFVFPSSLILCRYFQSKNPLPYKAPAKRSQHANATNRNIVGRNMLRAFGQQHVAIYCVGMLGSFGRGLRINSIRQYISLFEVLKIVIKYTKNTPKSFGSGPYKTNPPTRESKIFTKH